MLYQLVHDGQCQRRISAGQQLNMLVAFVSGFGFAWVNANKFGTVALGLLCVAPKMQIAGDAVATPNDDKFALRKKLYLHANFAAQGLHQAFSTCR